MAGVILKLHVGLIFLAVSSKANLFANTLQEQDKPAYHCGTFKAGACSDGWKAWGRFCYKALYGIFSWQAATTTVCTQIGGWLAVPNMPEENAFILSMSAYGAEGVWINCTDMEVEGIWKCLERGSEITYRSWGVGEPNNAAGKEDCAVMEHDGYWHDVYCDYKHYSVVCKRPAPSVLLTMD